MRRRRKERKKQGFKIQREEKTVVIATPMMDVCHSAFTTSLVHLVAHTMNESAAAGEPMTLAFLNYGTSILPLSRQFLAVRALEANATHMLWIDSDMEFPPDLILRMAKHDHPIVAANCMARRPPFNLTARYEDGKQVPTSKDSTGLEKVARVGFGVVWMQTDVLRKIPVPWFDLEWLPDKGIFRGEDFYFCEKAKQSGFDLYVDHDVSKEIKHIGLFGYNPTLRGSAGLEGDAT